MTDDTPTFQEFQQNRKVRGIWKDLVADLVQGVPVEVVIPEGKEVKSVRASIYNAANKQSKKITFITKPNKTTWVCWMD